MADYKQDFFTKYTPVALQVERETGIPAALILSQAALESNYGQSGLTKNFNNFFGIKGEGALLPTSEVYNGKTVKIKASFRKYNSPEESFRDYAKLLTTSPNYRGVAQASKTGTLADVVQAIDASPYATDPNYGQKLATIIQNNNLNNLQVPKAVQPQGFMQKVSQTIAPRVQAAEPVQSSNLPQPSRFSLPTMAQTPTTTPTPTPLTALNNSMQGKTQTMRIPTPGTYLVKRGDTLSGIAKQQLGNANRFREISGYRSGNPNLIYPGERLTIPKGI